MSKVKKNEKLSEFKESDLFENKDEFVPFVSGVSGKKLIRVINKAVEENIFSAGPYMKKEEDERR